jgi:hypothetical protein
MWLWEQNKNNAGYRFVNDKDLQSYLKKVQKYAEGLEKMDATL